jgi:hypothetical protein
MYENNAWIYLEYLGDEHLGNALDIDPVITLANQHRFVVRLTRIGQVFLETGRNPPSRHSRTRSIKPKEVSQTPRNQSIADMVRSKERNPQSPKTKLRRGSELLPR